MRITFVTPTFNPTGGMRIVAMYADRLQKRGHEVVVVSAHVNQPSLLRQIKRLVKGEGLYVPPKFPENHFNHVTCECREIDRYGPLTDADIPDGDVVIATWWETAEWVTKLSPSKGVKAYFIQHHEIFPYLPVERVKATWTTPMQKILVAQWLVDVARNEYGDHYAICVPNGIDAEQFYAPPRSKQATPTIGMMYAEAEWKGCDISLKAFSLAAKEVPGLRLVAFGHCPPLDRQPLPSGAAYIQCPNQDRVREIYSQCDAWLFASRSEGFGLPVLEAMACRTPVIGTPAGAAPDLLANGGGFLVEPESPEDMAKAIVKICQMSKMEWQTLSGKAHATAMRHTWGETTEIFENALHLAIQRAQENDPAHPRKRGEMQLTPKLAS
jgi:glycosyltransferase involved in cell wall biosynthesis